MTMNGLQSVLRKFFHDTSATRETPRKIITKSNSSNVKPPFLIVATNLANEKMEQVFADKNGRGYPNIVQTNYPSVVNPDGQSGYERYVTISDSGAFKEVEVRVTHNDISDLILAAFLPNY